jgi:hypothetical protein
MSDQVKTKNLGQRKHFQGSQMKIKQQLISWWPQQTYQCVLSLLEPAATFHTLQEKLRAFQTLRLTQGDTFGSYPSEPN